MLQPKKTKYRKFQKGRIGGVKMNALSFGSFGIQSVHCGRLSASVIEATRRVMTRKLKRSGQIWIRVFPDTAVSKKPAEVRMGKGKGSPDFWACSIQQGQILFELDGVSPEAAYQAFLLASQKLPVQTKFVVDSLMSFRPPVSSTLHQEKRKDL
jgi:large subunit ribosomal protein L16